MEVAGAGVQQPQEVLKDVEGEGEEARPRDPC